jgi:hypothetical protein
MSEDVILLTGAALAQAAECGGIDEVKKAVRQQVEAERKEMDNPRNHLAVAVDIGEYLFVVMVHGDNIGVDAGDWVSMGPLTSGPFQGKTFMRPKPRTWEEEDHADQD